MIASSEPAGQYKTLESPPRDNDNNGVSAGVANGTNEDDSSTAQPSLSGDSDIDDTLNNNTNSNKKIPTVDATEDDILSSLEIETSCNKNKFCICLKRSLCLCRCCCCCVYTTHDPYDISAFRQFSPHNDPFASSTSLYAGSSGNSTDNEEADDNFQKLESPKRRHHYNIALQAMQQSQILINTDKNVKCARIFWYIFFICYLLNGILYWSKSMSIFSVVCYNDEITDAIDNVLSDSDNDICELYYWIYIELAPIIWLIIAYATYATTLKNDMRGDRLIAMLNVIAFALVVVLLVFFNYINSIMQFEVCVDYESSDTYEYRIGCQSLVPKCLYTFFFVIL